MNKIPLSVLLIDDDAGDAELVRRCLLELAEFDVRFTHRVCLAEAQAEIDRGAFDVILVDYMLGPECGGDVLSQLRAAGELRPIVALTGHGEGRVAAAMMRAGADDYVSKGEASPLALRRAIDIGRANFARRKMESMNHRLLEDLQAAKAALECKNRRLTALYETAHQFVDHVSHEFRTPLTVIKEFASIMHDGLSGPVNNEQREYLDIIAQRVDDLSVLVDDMLDISKLEAGAMSVCRGDCRVADILEHVRLTLERRAAASSASLEIDVPADLPEVFCDAEKAGRIIINLVINALKFCGQPGRVILRAEHAVQDHEVRISVNDNGPGIAPDSLARLFKRFGQLDGAARAGVKGFGLGLSIVKELVDLNFGSITVETEPGRGSTFTFSLPTADRRALIERFVRRASTFRGGARWCALVSVSCDATAGPNAIEDLGRLMRAKLRRTDLALCTSPHEWLIVVAANQPDVTELLARIRHAHADAAPDGPPIACECLGSWSIQDQLPSVVEAFLHACGELETAHA